MFIFEAPFVSDELARYAEETATPVLDNDFARELCSRYALVLQDDRTFARNISAGKRLYTVSENALDWVYRNVQDESLLNGIRLMKDKAAMRSAMKKMYPEYFFRKVPAAELRVQDISNMVFPFILKPAVGFYSMGVYTITTSRDWTDALDDIDRQIGTWKEQYPAEVLGDADFILEEFISGDEFAIDVYFNDNGEAVVLNILKHDFSSAKDVSDKLYYTSKEIILERLAPFTDFLNTANSLLQMRNFPAHVEVRVMESGRIMPIEYNPMRFAGWGTTDLAYFAVGVRTYDYYLNDRIPDWNTLLAGKDGRIYPFVILEKPHGDMSGKVFDFDALQTDFDKVLHLRRMDNPAYPMFGVLFGDVSADDRSGLERLLRSDLTEYLRIAV